jgi:hypothetical protein
MREVYQRAKKREMKLTIYTEELFKTYNDGDNRIAVAAVKAEDLKLIGMAINSKISQINTVVKGLMLNS